MAKSPQKPAINSENVIRRLRTLLQLSQRQLARLSGLPLWEIKNIEHGVSGIRPWIAYRIQLATGANAEDLADRHLLVFSCDDPTKWRNQVLAHQGNVDHLEQAVRSLLETTLHQTKNDRARPSLHVSFLTELLGCLAAFRENTRLVKNVKTARWRQHVRGKTDQRGLTPAWTKRIFAAPSEGTAEGFMADFVAEGLVTTSELHPEE